MVGVQVLVAAPAVQGYDGHLQSMELHRALKMHVLKTVGLLFLPHETCMS